MLPATASFYDELTTILEKEVPSKTYKIDFKTNRIVGKIDGHEAMKQAIFKIFHTELNDYLKVYNGNYGSEFKELIGKQPIVVLVQLAPRITEALLRDDRITSIVDFNSEVQKDKVIVSFTAKTIFGDVEVDSYEVALE